MSNQPRLHILSVQPNHESRLALQKALSSISDFHLVGEAANELDLLQKLQESQVDVVMLGLPEVDAVGLTKQIRKTNSSIRVLIITGSDSPDDIFAAMDAGADAYILKNSIPNVIELAIRSARSGAVWLDPGIAKQVLEVVEAPPAEPSRILPTGFLRMPLMPNEKSILSEVASGNCKDGVCMVDPSFIRKLKRFSSSAPHNVQAR
jgi:two-component system, NarL family, response regulator LiaR